MYSHYITAFQSIADLSPQQEFQIFVDLFFGFAAAVAWEGGGTEDGLLLGFDHFTNCVMQRWMV